MEEGKEKEKKMSCLFFQRVSNNIQGSTYAIAYDVIGWVSWVLVSCIVYPVSCIQHLRAKNVILEGFKTRGHNTFWGNVKSTITK